MPISQLLPLGLLILLFASPALTETPVTTTYDPLYHISKQVKKAPEPPICCLKPLSPAEPAEEILSFEDWKAKQLALQAQVKKPPIAPPNQAGNGNLSLEPSLDAIPAQSSTADSSSLPHFRVPLTDRFNYASLDCSARIHSSHSAAKSPASILSSKKDRYMLSPCTTKQPNFVVVELCEDIRIDTVQLANFEFFSGVLKDFNVSVSKTPTTDPEGWAPAGIYRAKNIRGVQSFHPPTTLRDFYRYIRIDFLTHYGNEYYCPISLLRVYGLTHLEHWKWDVWEAESRAKKGEVEGAVVVVPPTTVGDEIATNGSGSDRPVEQVESLGSPEKVQDTALSSSKTTAAESAAVSDGTVSMSQPTTANKVGHDQETSMPGGDQSEKDTGEAHASSVMSMSKSAVSTISTQYGAVSITSSICSSTPSHGIQTTPTTTAAGRLTNTASSIIQSDASSSPTVKETNMSTPTGTESNSLSQATDGSSNSRVPSPASSPSSSSSVASPKIIPTILSHAAHPVPAVASAGESIYRTIMNRLTLLETNATLYTRYVEEQTRSVRDALLRLEEDVGRLEGIGKAQAQLFQRTMQEWDKQRKRLEKEHGELVSQVQFLADEVVLEKRLGIAQLCLLLTVLVFMALTRGSRGESFMSAHNSSSKSKFGIPSGRRDSLREWGRRNLSFSGSWVGRFRSRSPRPSVVDYATASTSTEDKIKFPSREPQDLGPSLARRTPVSQKLRSPIMMRTPISRRPGTPLGNSVADTRPRSISNAGGRPQLRRSNSQSSPAVSIGPVPKSAKKWAKTAHLHEIQMGTSKSGGKQAEESKADGPRDVENGGDVFWPTTAPATVTPEIDGKTSHGPAPGGRTPLLPLENLTSKQVQASTWKLHGQKSSDVDTEAEGWVDTDVEESASGRDTE